MYKAVIVDDENIVRVALGTIIDWRQYQFEVAGTASNGEEAIRLIRQKPIDLVVTDLKMPAMNGLDLIENLKREGFKGEIIILSNYDDFEMVRKGLTLGAADYLLKLSISPESFAEVLEKIKARLDKKQKNLSSRSAVHEEHKEYEELKTIREWQSLLMGEAPQGLFCDRRYLPQKGKRMLLFYLQLEESTWLWEDEKEKFLPSVSNIIKGIFPEKQELYVVPVSDFSIVILYREDDGNPISVAEKAEQMASLLSIYLNIQASVVYSDRFENPQKAAELMRSAQNMVQWRFYQKKPMIAPIAEEKTKKTAEELPGIDAGIMEFILDALKEQDLESCQSLLHRMGKNWGERRVPPRELKKSLQAFIEDCCGKLFGTRRLIPENILQEIQKASDIFRMETAVQEGFCWIAEESKREKYGGYRREVVEILQYIDQNTDKKLTLADIAQQVRMNESYMCTVFKEQVGKSIISYINEKKMQLAVHLIENTDIYIKEVAKQVGITDPFYFNRLFKKYYGVTPSRYKEQIVAGKGRQSS